MDWEAAGVIAATMMSGLALGVSIQGQRRADERAREGDEQVRRAAVTAERSANATERMAAALETRAIEDERQASTPGVAWRLEHFQNDAYLLMNAGRATAHDVRVELGDHMFGGDLPEDATLAPGGVVKFMAGRSLATRDDTVTVTWSNRPGGADRASWSRPLPPRPVSPHIVSLSTGEQIREALRLSSHPGSRGDG